MKKYSAGKATNSTSRPSNIDSKIMVRFRKLTMKVARISDRKTMTKRVKNKFKAVWRF
jgi:hypothetical protein